MSTLTPYPAQTVYGLGAGEQEGVGVRGLPVSLPPMIPTQVRQGGIGATISSTPLTGSVLVVMIGVAANPPSGASLSGGGVGTWNQVGSAAEESGAGGCTAALFWGVVGASPSTTLTGSLGALGAATAYAWMEVRGLLGIQRAGSWVGGSGANPAQAYAAAMRSTAPGPAHLFAATMSNGTAASNGLTQAGAGAQSAGARQVWIGYALMSIPKNEYCNLCFRVTGGNSRIVGGGVILS